MAEPLLKKDIEQFAMDIIKQSGALDVFPTPVNRIVSCAELIVSGEVDLSRHKPTFFSKLSATVFSAWVEVRGFLDRREKIIYLDKSVGASRQNFVSLHEVGHEVLPWQAATLSFLDNDETLAPHVKEEYEVEANYFASGALFQLDRFDREVKKMGVSIKAAMAISKKYGASVHATLRRMVEFQPRSCALIVLENRTTNHCMRRNVLASSTFIKKYGEIDLPEMLDRSLPFAEDFINRRKFLEGKVVKIPSTNQLLELKYEFFFNGYCAFVLLYPEGELLRPRMNYVFKGIEQC
ncbi:MAG: ImmA/IrrE family metallo-endopeptidase [Candidatus Pseudobacter hemicellulosilyticus]|uniref:ImmA/IrrE family metallo-endopeptidase n=1 Tax=Candidatus Pseudobacter hemicellulosilyticus TaxID=3121375 RepID=A0AAJ6BHH0_9BACT|nr:MAG: ImmA/IrrE family metallo-endopeptidase [Pseudobacter sp.]